MSTIATTDRMGWFGRPATGGAISYRIVLLFTVANGKVGGDFFEFLEMPSGDVGILMGDVAGKGPAAALLAAMLQGMFAVDTTAGGPALTLSRINQRLVARRLESRFATLVYGVLSPNGRFVYTNAGHNPPALLTPDSIRRLTTGGPIVGAFADIAFEEETLYLRELETLVMFTDGVTEARRADGEEFGEERLMACLTANSGSSPVVLPDHIFAAIREFCRQADQSDDMTIIVTRFLGRARTAMTL